jgi:hypothetical protein
LGPIGRQAALEKRPDFGRLDIEPISHDLETVPVTGSGRFQTVDVLSQDTVDHFR